MNGTRRLRGGMAGLALSLAASFGLALPATGNAQVLAQAGPGWAAWLGCWEPVPAEGAAVPAVTPYLCFLPGADGARVETVTVERGAVTNRQTLDASGSPVSVTRDECSGTEAMQWSEDVTRIYQRSTYVCPGGLQRQSTGIFSMTATGEWLDVAAVTVGEATNVRVMRYRAAPEVETSIQEIAQALNGRGLARETARAAAMAPVERADLLEAASHVHAGALEGWLIELGQPFRMDRQRIIEMADAGLPERVIDVMVALSYPDVFAIDRAGRPTEIPAQAEPGIDAIGMMMDPWVGSYNYLGLLRAMYPGYYLNSYYFYDPVYSPYGYGGYGYNGYGYGGLGPGYNRPIIVVVPEQGSGDGAPDGRAVNGRGYTRGGSDTGNSGPSRSIGGSDSGSSSPSGSSGASSGGSSGGGSTGRTARPKD